MVTAAVMIVSLTTRLTMIAIVIVTEGMVVTIPYGL